MIRLLVSGWWFMRELIRLLADGEFHSGEELGRILGVSRATVWKRLSQLADSTGLSICRVRGKGYRLAWPMLLLEYADLQDLPWPVHLHEVLDSTNAEALRRLALQEGRSSPFLVMAEQQLAGRGRRGRAWISPYGVNLYFSLLLPVESAQRLDGLSLLVGLAMKRGLSACGYPAVGLKWPNDLLLDGRKLGGILLELCGDPADRCHVVIGVGLNINLREGEVSLDQPWTSLALERGRAIARSEILKSVLAALDDVLEQSALTGFAAFRSEWEAAHVWQGRQVVLSSGTRTMSGRVLGVDDHGALRLLCDDGEQLVSGGELSLRLADDT